LLPEGAEVSTIPEEPPAKEAEPMPEA